MRHWRGEYPLGRSFWLNGVVAWHLALLTAVGLALMNPDDGSQTAKFVSAFSLFPLVVLVWIFVRIWRSAGNARRGGAWFWPVAARLWLLLVLAFELIFVATMAISPPDL
jgi:hypothetical protein